MEVELEMLEALEMEEELEMLEALEVELEVEEKEVKALVNVEVTPTVQERLRTALSGDTAGPRLATQTEAPDPRLTLMLGSVELTPTVLTGLRTAPSLASAGKHHSLGRVGQDNIQ